MRPPKLTPEQRSANARHAVQALKDKIARGELPADHFSKLGKKGGAVHANKMRIKREMTVTKI